ncbi:MAG: hypothetical protein AB7H77_04020 [Bdellovibrionales bacterium]
MIGKSPISNPFARSETFGASAQPKPEAPRPATGGFGSGMGGKDYGQGGGARSSMGGMESGIKTKPADGGEGAVMKNPFLRKSAVDAAKEKGGEVSVKGSLRPGDSPVNPFKSPARTPETKPEAGAAASPAEAPKPQAGGLGSEAGVSMVMAEKTGSVVETEKGLQVALVKPPENDYDKRLQTAMQKPDELANAQMTSENYMKVHVEKERVREEERKEAQREKIKEQNDHAAQISANDLEAATRKYKQDLENAALAQQARDLQTQIGHYKRNLDPNNQDEFARISTTIAELERQYNNIPSVLRG